MNAPTTSSLLFCLTLFKYYMILLRISANYQQHEHELEYPFHYQTFACT